MIDLDSMMTFQIKGPIGTIDDTGGDEPIHPAKILSIEWGDHVVQVLVRAEVFEAYADALEIGDFVSLVGKLYQAPGVRWHIATSLSISGKKH
jgi:hypothetical protein